MKSVVNVKPMDNYMLAVEYDNGECRIFDCGLLLKDNIYSKLQDISFFRGVFVDDMGVVCWEDNIDISPSYLYNNSIKILKGERYLEEQYSKPFDEIDPWECEDISTGNAVGEEIW